MTEKSGAGQDRFGSVEAGAKRYQELTVESVKEYVKAKGFFPREAELACEEIGDGNLNYVFRLRHARDGRSVIVKQALPYAKVVGESWPLTLQRNQIESDYLREAARVAPDLVPEVFLTDDALAAMVMEDLSALQVLRKGLIAGRQYPRLAEHIGRFMASVHFATSDFGMNQQKKKELAAAYCNPELCKITEDLVFTDPFFDHETNNFPVELTDEVRALWSDDALKRETAGLKLKFLTEAQALLHGDLHSGSIFADAEQTKVIDPEFAFVGPIGFDIGSFVANLFLNELAQRARMKGRDDDFARMQAFLCDTAEQTWAVYEREFRRLWETEAVEAYCRVPGLIDRVLAGLLRDTVGFAGCELIRRTIGLAHVEDIDGIEDEADRLAVQRLALQFGRKLILEHASVGDLREVTGWLKAL